jgi:hypothetical protein
MAKHPSPVAIELASAKRPSAKIDLMMSDRYENLIAAGVASPAYLSAPWHTEKPC